MIGYHTLTISLTIHTLIIKVIEYQTSVKFSSSRFDLPCNLLNEQKGGNFVLIGCEHSSINECAGESEEQFYRLQQQIIREKLSSKYSNVVLLFPPVMKSESRLIREGGLAENKTGTRSQHTMLLSKKTAKLLEIYSVPTAVFFLILTRIYSFTASCRLDNIRYQ